MDYLQRQYIRYMYNDYKILLKILKNNINLYRKYQIIKYRNFVVTLLYVNLLYKILMISQTFGNEFLIELLKKTLILPDQINMKFK